jgi:hypothetical protein
VSGAPLGVPEAHVKSACLALIINAGFVVDLLWQPVTLWILVFQCRSSAGNVHADVASQPLLGQQPIAKEVLATCNLCGRS